MSSNNGHMEFPGHVQNGVIVLEGKAALPEGAAVIVLCPPVRIPRRPKKSRNVEATAIRSKQPGTLPLTNQLLAEIAEEEDIRKYAKFFPKRKKS
jgi:hypothetical protein